MLTLNIPANLVQGFKDFMEVHGEMQLEHEDGSTMEVTEAVIYVLDQLDSDITVEFQE